MVHAAAVIATEVTAAGDLDDDFSFKMLDMLET
jgi:hypothetical protein